MNIAVIGSRSFADYQKLESFILQHISVDQIDFVVSHGSDRLAERFASNFGLKTLIFPADWSKHGKSAGYRRNITIIENADIVFAFWDGTSKGTKHSINLATKTNKELYVYAINSW